MQVDLSLKSFTKILNTFSVRRESFYLKDQVCWSWMFPKMLQKQDRWTPLKGNTSRASAVAKKVEVEARG